MLQTQLETLFLAADLNKDGKLDMVDFMTFTNQLASKHASASSASSSSSSPPTDDSKRSFDWESRPAKVVADLWVKEIPPPLQPSKSQSDHF